MQGFNGLAVRAIGYSALLAGASLPAVAFAQAADGGVPEATEETNSGDIIVTAQRRSESLQKVPMSVDVATGEKLEKFAITDIKDIGQLAPGVELTNSDGRRNVATIRGIAFEPDTGGDPSVDVYLNDINVDAQVVFGAIYDISQIEVLRGPQGIFRGRTSPAGAITIATRRPDLNDPEGYVQGNFSTLDAINVQGGASIPIVPGKLAIRFSGLVDFNRVGHVRTIYGEESSAKTMSARISLAFEPTDRFRANLMYQYYYSDVTPYIAMFGPGNTPYAAFGDNTPTGPVLTLEDRLSVTRTRPRFENTTHFVTLDTEFDVTDNITWSIDAGYQHTRQKQTYPNLGTEASVPGYMASTSLLLPPQVLTIDTRLNSSNDGPFNWMFGGYFQDFHSVSTIYSSESDLFFGTPTAPLPQYLAPAVNIVSDLVIPIKKQAYAVFGSLRYDVTDSLRVEAGLRYTWFKFDQQSIFSFCFVDFGFCSPNQQVAYDDDVAKRSESALTGGATVSYDWSPDLTTYFAYGHAYRPTAAQNGAALSGITNPDLLLSKPEKSDAFEVGIKGKLFEGRLNAALAAFYQKYDNYVAYAPGINVRGVNGITSVPTAISGDATSTGVELQLSGRVTDNFDLGVGASYVDAHWANAEVACNLTTSGGAAFIPPGQDYATCIRNDRIAQVPKFSASINGEYRFTMGELTPFIRGLLSYRPGFVSTTDNYTYEAITNINLYLGLRGADDRWEISGFVKNLLDQARATIVSSQQLQQSTDQGFFVAPGAPHLSGYRTASVTPPREFGLTARFKW